MVIFPSRRSSVPLLVLALFDAQKLQGGLDAHVGGSGQRRRGGDGLPLGGLLGVDRRHVGEALLVSLGFRGRRSGELVAVLAQELLRAAQADSCRLGQRAYGHRFDKVGGALSWRMGTPDTRYNA